MDRESYGYDEEDAQQDHTNLLDLTQSEANHNVQYSSIHPKIENTENSQEQLDLGEIESNRPLVQIDVNLR